MVVWCIGSFFEHYFVILFCKQLFFGIFIFLFMEIYILIYIYVYASHSILFSVHSCCCYTFQLRAVENILSTALCFTLCKTQKLQKNNVTNASAWWNNIKMILFFEQHSALWVGKLHNHFKLNLESDLRANVSRRYDVLRPVSYHSAVAIHVQYRFFN